MNQKNVPKTHAALAVLFAAGVLAAEAYAQHPPAGAAGGADGPQQTPKAASVPSNKVVLKVGEQQATADDLNFVLHSLNEQDQRAVESQGRRPLGEQYAVTLLLARQGAQDHLDASPDFRRQEAWERAQRLAQAEYEKMARAIKIDAIEVGQYYTQHPKDFEQVEVRQVGIRKKAEGAKPESPGLTAQDAEAKADAIRKALMAGADIQKISADFAVPNVVFIDPATKKLQRGQLSAGLEKIFSLKDGEVSSPFSTPQ